MKNINAIILNKKALEFEILFKKVADYITLSLNTCDIENVFFADNLSDISEDMLDCDGIIIIDDIVPEILEYDRLVSSHFEKNSDISFFSTKSHSHTEGIELDENDSPCGFGCSSDFSKINIFLVCPQKFKSNKNIIENPFDYNVNFVEIAESTVIFDIADVVSLTTDFKEEINFMHINNGVYLLDPATTYIESGVIIESGTTILPGCIIKGNTSIGSNCTIGPNSLIDSCDIHNNVTINCSQVLQSSIGASTSVGPFAYIRPDTKLGKNVKIGDFVELKKATIDDGSKVSHLTYVGDASVGKNVNIGCGTVFVNYDGYNKFKAVVEDDCFIGCNTNLISPVTLKKGSMTAAGTTVTNTVECDDLAISRVRQENKPLWAKKFRELKSKK